MSIWSIIPSKDTEDKIMSYIKNSKKVKLLDYGAGYGRYLEMFNKYIPKQNLYSIEVCKESCDEIRKKGFNCYNIKINKSILPFEDNYFDYIFTSNVLEHIENQQYKKILLEFSRILKKDGVLLIGGPSYPYKRYFDVIKAYKTKKWKYYLFDDPTHCNKLSILQYEKDLKEIFSYVKLNPTQVLFENICKKISNDKYKYRKYCDKFFGCAKKV